jgi:hypothetical protein
MSDEFEDIQVSPWEVAQMCSHPEHNPPMHIHIPQGKQLKHTCPGCKQVQVVRPPQISLEVDDSRPWESRSGNDERDAGTGFLT